MGFRGLGFRGLGVSVSRRAWLLLAVAGALRPQGEGFPREGFALGTDGRMCHMGLGFSVLGFRV